MSSDSSAARPGSGKLRAGTGSETTARNERVERSDATDPALSAVGGAAPSAVKEPPAPTFGNGAGKLPRAGTGRPTEVYDQVHRQWVTVGEPTAPAPAPPPVPDLDAEPGALVTAASQVTTRKARLAVSTVDPWSVMKLSFVLSLAGAIVLLVTVWLMWLLLSNGGVFVSVDKTVGDIAGSSTSFSIVDIFSLRRVMGVTLMLAVVQVILVTALATLGAFLYNLAAGLVGGLDVTLSEDR